MSAIKSVQATKKVANALYTVNSRCTACLNLLQSGPNFLQTFKDVDLQRFGKELFYPVGKSFAGGLESMVEKISLNNLFGSTQVRR
tara:strand:- start:990 stop:1247 length:258 start_codon:yes stop_codon:yes gene_type:complete